MTVIYGDLLALLNFTADLLLLRLTARMSGSTARRWRQVLAAALGGVYAVLPYLVGEWLSGPLWKLGMGILMSLIAFGGGRKAVRTTLIFFASAAALGGAVWAVELMGGTGLTLENGVLYSRVDIRLLLAVLILSYVVLSAVSDRLFVHRTGETVPVEVVAGDRRVTLTALLDTGNTLTDPATDRPVMVAEGRACRALLPLPVPLERPVEALELLDAAGRKEFRLLPYRAVGVQSGLLLCLRADRVTVGGRAENGVLVALSPTEVSDGGGYQALIGGTSWSS